MKKNCLLLLLFIACCAALPASATMQFYRTQDGQLIAEINDCRDASRMMNLLDWPDDPPETNTEAPEKENTSSQEEVLDDVHTISPDVAEGASTIANAIFGPDTEPRNRNNSHGISQTTEDLLDASTFDERQDSFITFVRDVNWKTGLQITFRDFSFFRRLHMACVGINQFTKPFRFNLGSFEKVLDDNIDKVTGAGIQELAIAARAHSFTAMSRLSVVGLAVAIEKENPFLLLAMDEETYQKLVAFEPRIAQLFEDMYIFFKIRSVRMGEFSANIKDLIRVSKIGKGDAFNTWHIMAAYAQKMLELERQDKLDPEDEKEIHIWRLESSMRYVQEHIRVEQRAAFLAAKDPNNASLISELDQEPKKRPSLDEKAIELLKKSTQEEIKHLIRKYITK